MVLPEIEKCYSGEFYAPYPYVAIKQSLEMLPLTLNANLPKLIKVDKEALLQKFNERLTTLEAKRMKAQTVKDKYIL